MLFRFGCIVLLAAVSSAGIVEYQDCGSSDSPIGLNIVLRVDGVPDGTTSVTLVKKHTYNLEIEFTATKESLSLKNVLSAEIGSIELQWNGIDPEACQFLPSGSCPLKAGTRYIYKNSLTVEQSYPATSLKIIWKLVDADSANEVCFKLPAKIVNARNRAGKQFSFVQHFF